MKFLNHVRFTKNNPHIWIIVFITIVLLFVYSVWPWRYWQFTQGIWGWFPWLSSLYHLALVEMRYHLIGILFLIPIIYAALVFSWQGALVICIIAILGIWPIMIDMWQITSLLANIILLVLPFFIVSFVTFELAWRRRDRRIFNEREAERQVYVSKILESQENERQRIAQGLHDDTIQTLLSISHQSQAILSCDEHDAEIGKSVENIRTVTLQAIDGLRRTILDLRPRILDELGLVPAIKWLLGRMKKESGINTGLTLSGNEYELTLQAEVVIFRSMQEALHNIERHSKATDATVEMDFSDSYLKIIIKDNGEGFSVPDTPEALSASGRLGIIAMQQRIQLINGVLAINSVIGHGTSIFITVSTPDITE